MRIPCIRLWDIPGTLSDLGGCDNIWRLDLASRAVTPLTEEPYRFVNNAQWHPNGTSLVAVKWFTSTRSIPAGEIWLFELDPAGADRPVVASRQLVGRPSASTQVGPEEPVFDADGRTVFYSLNTADSSTFNYNKDPHAGTWSATCRLPAFFPNRPALPPPPQPTGGRGAVAD